MGFSTRRVDCSDLSWTCSFQGVACSDSRGVVELTSHTVGCRDLSWSCKVNWWQGGGCGMLWRCLVDLLGAALGCVGGCWAAAVCGETGRGFANILLKSRGHAALISFPWLLQVSQRCRKSIASTLLVSGIEDQSLVQSSCDQKAIKPKQTEPQNSKPQTIHRSLKEGHENAFPRLGSV